MSHLPPRPQQRPAAPPPPQVPSILRKIDELDKHLASASPLPWEPDGCNIFMAEAVMADHAGLWAVGPPQEAVNNAYFAAAVCNAYPEMAATLRAQAETIRLQSNLDPDAFFRFIADEKVKELEEECQLERDASWIFFIMALAGWLAAFAVAFAYGLRVVLK